jgi:Flp pilus assembly protein TadG
MMNRRKAAKQSSIRIARNLRKMARIRRYRAVTGIGDDPYMDRHLASRLVRLPGSERGAALVEMAITLPVLLVLLMGIVSYGDWMFTAHTVQQTANDAARAAIAGLTGPERAGIAQTTMETNMRRSGALDPAKAVLSVDDDGTTLVVRLRYDANADPLLHLGIVPMPGALIQRNAAIRLDGL